MNTDELMRITHFGILAVLALVAANASADRVIGVYGGIGSWSQNYSGTVAAGGKTSGDSVLSRDLDWRGVTYSASESVVTDIDVNQIDVPRQRYRIVDKVDFTRRATNIRTSRPILAEIAGGHPLPLGEA